MAITKLIREKGNKLLLFFIALALVAFLLMDVLSSNSIFRSSGPKGIGSIDGVELDQREFDTKINNAMDNYKANQQITSIDEATRISIIDQIWDDHINERIMAKELKKVGLGVGENELADLVYGTNVHPRIKQLFTNPQTGEFNTAAVINFVKSLDQAKAEDKQLWLQTEKDVIRDREMQKYITLLGKGLGETPALIAIGQANGNDVADASLIWLEYASITDGEIKVTESDLETYFAAHKNDFKSETPSRKVEYVAFSIAPSGADTAAAYKKITELNSRYSTTTDDSAFVALNSDLPFEDKYIAQDKMLSIISDQIFASSPGALFGPYMEDGYFKVTKLLSTATRPDSVRARHILLRDGSEAGSLKADSLMRILKSGFPFESMASSVSEDGSAAKGGDLGYFADGNMVKEFNDSCFNNPVGKLMKVKSQFGYHIVIVTDKKDYKPSVKVGTVALKIEPSKETRNLAFGKANKFLGSNKTIEDFEKAVDDQKLSKRVVDKLNPMDAGLPGLNDTRNIVRAAFQTEKTAVLNDIYESGYQYIVACVAGVRNAGVPALADIKDDVKVKVLQEMKANMLVEKAKKAGSGNLEAIAAGLGKEVMPAPGISYNAGFLPQIGREPKVIGQLFSMKTNTVSAPIVGERGVYVVRLDNVVKGPEQSPEAIAQMAMQMQYFSMQNAQTKSTAALKKKYNVEDNRYLYY